MFQGRHHHTCAKEICSILLQRLPSCRTDTHHREVFRKASHVTQQIHPTPHPGPLPVCTPSQTIHRGCNLCCSPPSPHPLDKKDSYVRMLFIDFSSTLNTIIPQKLICKLDKLGLSSLISLCNWLLDFLVRGHK